MMNLLIAAKFSFIFDLVNWSCFKIVKNEIEKCFESVDLYADKYLDFIRTLVKISSKTEDKEGVDAVLDKIIEHENENGYILIRQPMEKAGDVASLTLFNGENLPTVCLSAHMDTVFKKGEFAEPVVTEDEENLYGPGVTDDKGGIAVGFLAMAALKNSGFDRANIKMILQSDEELSSELSNKKTIDFMCRQAMGSAAFLNLELGRDNALITARYGVIKAKFDVFGKSAHAAEKMKGNGINAIKEAANKILQIENREVSENLSFSVGTVNGGTTTNTIAEHCSFTVDCRIKSSADEQAAKEFLQSVADKQYADGTSCKLTYIGVHSPFEANKKTDDLFSVINAANIKYLGEELAAVTTGGGGDSAYPSAKGIPTVDSMGVGGGNLHTVREYMVKKSLAPRAKRVISAIYGIINQ